MIPRVAHFVFGLREQDEPFHFLHYASLESCRRVLEPDAILFHHKHLPWGPWWERIRPHLTLVPADLAAEVDTADYSAGHVPDAYLYAHHSDFVRLDALIEHGGVYADIDTIFLRPFPQELFEAPFVIGREPDVRDERTGRSRPSLCNALLLSEPGAAFAVEWRRGMADALNGTWSNHSGFLSEELSRRMPGAVRVEPETTFFSFPATRTGLAALLEQRHPVPEGAISLHLWAHLWWDRDRRDFSDAHAGWCTPSFLRGAPTTLADLLGPYVPRRAPAAADAWNYLSLDDRSGYGVAAERCIAALEESGVDVRWTPFVPGGGWGLHHEPLPLLDAPATEQDSGVVVSHLVPEYLPRVRERHPDALLVAHTAWETDRLPAHWGACLADADLVVVPSTFSARAVEGSAVTTPVAVVPHVAPAVVAGATQAWADIPGDVLVYYTIGEWNERKAVDRTIEAYLRAFRGGDRVLLVVKTSHRDHRAAPGPGGAAGPGTTPWAVARLLARHPDPPAVRLVTRPLPEAAIAALHRRGDCFVSLCRSEGWGLGAFDAAAYGNPVVTTGFGGHLDYLGGSPYLVDHRLVAVDDPRGRPSYTPDQRWAEPDVDHGAAMLRAVVADRDLAAARAGALAREIRERYGPAAVAAAFRAAVGSAGPPGGRSRGHAAPSRPA